MKIINLYAENLKRISAVEITPTGNLVEITGRNGQGKTSVLDAIWWALDGTKNVQTTPIRKGEEKAIVQLDLGELKITRRFKAQENGEYTTSITVENGEGARFSSPQKMLDDLLGELTFDPLAFTRMKRPDQVMALRSLVPGFDFAKAESDIKAAFEERTIANRQAKNATASADAIAEALPSEKPEATTTTELMEQLQKAERHNFDVKAQIEKWDYLSRQISEQNEIMVKAKERYMKLCEERDAMPQHRPEMIDISEISERITNAEEDSITIAEFNRMEEKRAEAKAAAEKSEKLTKDIEDIKAAAQQAIAEADMPVTGLTISDGSVYLDGVPFDQASDAQQLTASIGVAMALNPKLKVIRVRDGSLLDDEAMKTLAAIADERDYQIWIERVDSSGTVGFVLEDGMLQKKIIEEVANEPNDIIKEATSGGSLFGDDALK